MKRRTNLFYNASSDDSKFLTFSNYTESLTGNFLATDTKLFPSTFICAYIPSLVDAEAKDTFIKSYLVSKYENKLAFLRDEFAYEGKNCEDYMTPLKYLFETIYEYDESTEISLIGNITEEHYNGIYADTICVVDSSNYKTGSWVTEEIEPKEYIEYNTDPDHLYGWSEEIEGSYIYNGPSEYADCTPALDDDNMVTYQSDLVYINLMSADKDVKFNVLIPLYDVVNEATVEVSDLIEDADTITDSISPTYLKNVPLGIWFADDNVVELKHDEKYAPTWSLVIGSQFKPFPHGKYLKNEIESDATADAYHTFAEVLARQNRVLDQFEKINTTLQGMNTRLTLVESQVKSIASQANIDDLKIMINNVKTELETEIQNITKLYWEEK